MLDSIRKGFPQSDHEHAADRHPLLLTQFQKLLARLKTVPWLKVFEQALIANFQ